MCMLLLLLDNDELAAVMFFPETKSFRVSPSFGTVRCLVAVEKDEMEQEVGLHDEEEDEGANASSS